MVRAKIIATLIKSTSFRLERGFISFGLNIKGLNGNERANNTTGADGVKTAVLR